MTTYRGPVTTVFVGRYVVVVVVVVVAIFVCLSKLPYVRLLINRCTMDSSWWPDHLPDVTHQWPTFKGTASRSTLYERMASRTILLQTPNVTNDVPIATIFYYTPANVASLQSIEKRCRIRMRQECAFLFHASSVEIRNDGVKPLSIKNRDSNIYHQVRLYDLLYWMSWTKS
jgi:hypothetical protein